MLWAMAVLGYLYASWLQLPPFLFPLLLMVVCVIFLFVPFKQPEQIFRRNSRFWFLKHCFNCFTAPFHFVTFADFWLGDQMNSLTCDPSIPFFNLNMHFLSPLAPAFSIFNILSAFMLPRLIILGPDSKSGHSMWRRDQSLGAMWTWIRVRTCACLQREYALLCPFYPRWCVSCNVFVATGIIRLGIRIWWMRGNTQQLLW